MHYENKFFSASRRAAGRKQQKVFPAPCFPVRVPDGGKASPMAPGRNGRGDGMHKETGCEALRMQYMGVFFPDTR